MKVVALGPCLDAGGAAMEALQRRVPQAGVVAMRPGLEPVTLLRLLRLRPALVVAEAAGRGVLAAALYRMLAPSTRLVLQMPAEPLPRRAWASRLAVRRAQETVESGADLAEAIGRVRLAVPPAAALRAVPADIDMFAAIPATRDAGQLHRLLHVGPLSPESGAADLLVALASWAEDHPDRDIEIAWAGVGDLAGVFEAQPLPDNLRQRFLGDLDRRGLAEAFAAASIMVVPLTGSKLPVVEALASGLVLIGDRRSPALRPLIAAGGPIWAYGAAGQPDLLAALAGALGADPAALDALRWVGRRLACEAAQAALEHGRASASPGRLVSDEAFP